MSAFSILLVDDEKSNLALLEACLSPLGHELRCVTTGRDALRAFHEWAPDLVLLDYGLPDLSGLEVLKEIRSRSSSRRVPVVLVTAHADREHRLRGLEAGADEFLEKPIDRGILLTRVRSLLQLKEASDALVASNEELARRGEELEAARREQQELTAFIVHDLKTPLTVIRMGLEFLHSTDPDDATEIGRSASDSLEAAKRLSGMISDLLVISRMESAELALERETIHLIPLIADVARPFGTRARAKGIELARPADGSINIKADPAMVRRILENLLDNALRYTPASGRVAIEVRPGVEILVSNDGPPIPVGERESIFGKFKRGERERATPGNAGLGLCFCRRAARAHGGFVDVVDHRDFSTCFRVTLPA